MKTPYIIGWGHTPFGKLDNLDLGAARARCGAAGAAAAPDWSPRTSTASSSGHFNGGFVPQDFSGVARRGRDPRASATRRPCAWRTPAPPARRRSGRRWTRLQSGRMKRALVIGFEKMNTLPNAQIGEVAAEVLLRQGGRRQARRLRRRLRRDRERVLRALRRPVATRSRRSRPRTTATASHNPYAHMRRDLGYEFCRNPSDKNPFVAGPLKRSDCSLVSDGAAALVLSHRAGLRRPGAGGALALAGPGQRVPAAVAARPTRFEGAAHGLGSRASRRPGVELDDLDVRRDARLLHHRRAAGVRGDGAGAARAGCPRDPRRRHAQGRQAAGQPVRRPQVAGPSDRRHRRFAARDDGDAARRPGRGHADPQCAGWAPSSTWAVLRWPTTSACSRRPEP